MYIPDHFREDRPEALRAFIERHPLGALVALTPEGLTANHIPMHWEPGEGEGGVLVGHVARANPILKQIPQGAEVLVIFTGANRYITPSWYPAKKEHGKVVPTWNYSVVHAHGTLRFTEDEAQVLGHLNRMTDLQEGARAEPWAVSDAPSGFIQPMLSRIVPIEISLTRLIGKFKSSQHRPESERSAVVSALLCEGVSQADVDELIRAPGG